MRPIAASRISLAKADTSITRVEPSTGERNHLVGTTRYRDPLVRQGTIFWLPLKRLPGS